MRTWDQLNEKEQSQAISVARSDVIQRAINFPPDYLCGDSEELTERYESAVQEMERLQTPWFLAERLLEDEKLAASIDAMVADYAERAYYPDGDEPVLFVNFRQEAR